MAYDSIANASIPTAASNPKDFAKKKRVNRTAKLKQSKLDVRREQWLSQVKNRGLGLKEETNGAGGMKTPAPETRELNEIPIVKLEVNIGGEENEGLMNHYSDSESQSNSPTNFTGSSSRSSCGSSSSSGSGSGSGGCFSRSVTDEDDGDHEDEDDDDDDCLDDWEAMADALAADDNQKTHEDSNQEYPVHETPKPEPDTTRTGQVGFGAPVNFRAWRLDDTSRPESLPNLLKLNSFPMKSGVHHGVQFAPSSCPICCEDLDITDSSFLPCLCGYRLCLFCHKKILEDNGRCPGCRKQYDQIDHKTSPFKLGRCYSMNPRQ